MQKIKWHNRNFEWLVLRTHFLYFPTNTIICLHWLHTKIQCVNRKSLKFAFSKFIQMWFSLSRYRRNLFESFISNYKRYRILTPVRFSTLLSMNTYQIGISWIRFFIELVLYENNKFIFVITIKLVKLA